ncbi:MAG TPA: LON peptidase substrate-binding domain-containing protein [Solimonas sp.]|nr:LON peptidase substrate-binding domain-containing protein [Solimonas sp.]
MGQIVEMPLFPLGTVLFPEGRLPLRIFEQRYVDMTKACIRDDAPFGVALIRAGVEVGQPAIPWDIGCSARIAEWEVPSPGLFNLLARGETVFRILDRWTQSDGLLMGRVELLEPLPSQPLPERYAALGQLLDKLVEEVGAEVLPQPLRRDDAVWVGRRLTEMLPVPPEARQKMLEAGDVLTLLDGVERLLKRLGEDA